MTRVRGASDGGGDAAMEKRLTLYTINTHRGRDAIVRVIQRAQEASRERECSEVSRSFSEAKFGTFFPSFFPSFFSSFFFIFS